MPASQAPTARRRRLNREEKNAETQRRLLDAAREVFGRRGYGSASLEEIAEEAGFSRGALYHHFAGKEDLFLALLDERVSARVAEIERTFAAGEATKEATIEQARRAAGDAAEVFGQNHEWRALYLEFVAHADRNPEFRRQLAERMRACRDGLTELVRRRAAEIGLELPVPPEQLALTIEALGQGLGMEEMLDPDGVPEDLFGTMLGYLLRGIAADAS
jgi:AcrR family transcriptional regulator